MIRIAISAAAFDALLRRCRSGPWATNSIPPDRRTDCE